MNTSVAKPHPGFVLRHEPLDETGVTQLPLDTVDSEAKTGKFRAGPVPTLKNCL
jgi:hypothetical protein